MPTANRVLPDETGDVMSLTATDIEIKIPATTPEGDAEPRPRVSVIVPALNEARNLPHVFARLPEVDEILLVDGGSTDDTVAVARRLRPDIRVVVQNRKGKGNALACGFAEATGDIIVMIDADGSTDPLEIPSFVEALRDGADFAKGSRFQGTGGSADITRLRRAGNKCLSTLVNVLFGTRYSDLCYGYNAFWAHCLDVFDLDSTSPAPDNTDGRLWGDGFEIETLLNLRAAQAGLAIVEVASFEHSRIHGVSNLNAFTDGMRVLRTIAREWRPKRSKAGRRAKEMAQ
ncbi:glycosyltransferase family 2 protein [Actinoplanes flavus]|uniref:Glycosyltransferase family 2 protein n=1 Tax=Actinoplanes flavus TaxID=2820290 RepID=A0ABS3UW20_9ACTN|nr:glycosyltransferase family 2 protein [Actinoplanes flavus]MBO3742762.1 glycosyltransferase family 2 protein [Actinoplanes flavus]